MPVTAEAPNTGNLTIGKGIVTFDRGNIDEYRDVGEVKEFEVTLEIDQLDHFTQRQGTREKDLSVVLERSGNARMIMEEWIPENMAIMFMGSVDMAAVGGPTVTIMTEDAIEGRLKFAGAGDVGAKWNADLHRVRFIPSASINFISDEWGPLEVTGEILRNEDTGQFGTVQLTNMASIS